MEILIEKVNNIDVLKLKGRLDASSINDIKKQVNMLIKEARVNLIFDMSAIEFIDSSGLGSLVSCLRSVNKLDGDIRISSLQIQVRTIFELTRLHLIFQIFDDNDSAAMSFNTTSS